MQLPIQDVVKISCSHTKKTTSAIAFNNAGTRFAAGSHDYEMHIWDFNAIDLEHLEPIASAQPCGQTVIKNLDYSKDDQLILVISGGCQAILVAKDGIVNNQYKCPKGDQYITDMSNTRGHVQMLNDGCWSPSDDKTFITSSNDATIRIWHLDRLEQQKTVIKTRSPVNGIKTIPNVCKYSRDSNSIITGCNDGSILMWDTRRKFIAPSSSIRAAHSKGSEVIGIDYSHSMTKICSRSEDESCKVWDTRQLKQPIASKTNLSTMYSINDCLFSPDDKYVVIGTSRANEREESGSLQFLDSENLEVQHSLEASGANVIRVRWQPKINHIAYTCSSGQVHVAYDEQSSTGGLLVAAKSPGQARGGAAAKRKRYVAQNSTIVGQKIITPHALPLFRDEEGAQSFAKIRQDPRKSYKPEMPITGASQGGRVKPAGSTLSSYIARNIAKPADDGGLDIRDRILRHAEAAEREPFWIQSGGSDEPRGEKRQKCEDADGAGGGEEK